MKAVIKNNFNKSELQNCICITPQSFSAIKSWYGVNVEGLAYYVDKAVCLGAIKSKAKRKVKKSN